MGKMEKGLLTTVNLRHVINPFIIDHSIVIYAVLTKSDNFNIFLVF